MNRLKDGTLKKTIALPAAASTTVTTADLDLGVLSGREFPGTVEVVVDVPALNATMLPDTKTLTVQLQNGAAASPTTAIGEALVITGAGGVGAAASQLRVRLPSTALRYLNCKFTSGALTTTMAAVSGEMDLVF